MFIYNTGENHWDRLKNWPLACEQGCAAPLKPIYLQAGFGLGFDKPSAAAGTADTYVSDPAKPVPYITRPVRFADSDRWKQWLVTDQRTVADRTDVLAYQTPELTAPVRISGAPIADLFAATTGHRRGLGSEADRRVSRRSAQPAGDGRISTRGVDGYFPRALSRELRTPVRDSGRQAAATTVSCCRRPITCF